MTFPEKIGSFFKSCRRRFRHSSRLRAERKRLTRRLMNGKYIRTEGSNAQMFMLCGGITALLLMLSVIGLIFPGIFVAFSHVLAEYLVLRIILLLVLGPLMLIWLYVFIAMIDIVRNADETWYDAGLFEAVHRSETDFDSFMYDCDPDEPYCEYDEDPADDLFGVSGDGETDPADDLYFDDIYPDLYDEDEMTSEMTSEETDEKHPDDGTQDDAPENGFGNGCESDPENDLEVEPEKGGAEPDGSADAEEPKRAQAYDEPFGQHFSDGIHEPFTYRRRAAQPFGFSGRRGAAQSGRPGESSARRSSRSEGRFYGGLNIDDDEYDVSVTGAASERARAEHHAPEQDVHVLVCEREIEGQGRVTLKYSGSYIKGLICSAVGQFADRLYVKELNVNFLREAFEVEIIADAAAGMGHVQMVDELYAAVRQRLAELSEGLRVDLSLVIREVRAADGGKQE